MFLLLFADELALLSTTIVGLQTQLTNLYESAQRLKLTVNLEKSKVVVFRKGGYLAGREKWWFGPDLLEVVNTYKYLGLTFSTRLSFRTALEEAAVKGKKCVIQILITLKRIGCNSPHIFFKLFDSQVAPMLLYASEIWGFEPQPQIERVHTFACKKFLNVPVNTPNDLVYGDLGRYPLYILSMVRCVKYWFRILRQPDNFYSKKAYTMLVELHERGKTNWASQIKLILCRAGFGHVWLYGCGDEGAFIKILKQRLCDCFLQNWHSHLDSSERFVLYNSFKSCLEREKYVDLISYNVYRCALARFRMGVSPLNAHKYRFASTDDARKCPFCTDQLEDENHLLFICPIYKDLREIVQFLKRRNFTGNQICSLLRKREEKHILEFSKFLFQAFKLRFTLLNET